jgi:hypothetical protein
MRVLGISVEVVRKFTGNIAKILNASGAQTKFALRVVSLLALCKR